MNYYYKCPTCHDYFDDLNQLIVDPSETVVIQKEKPYLNSQREIIITDEPAEVAIEDIADRKDCGCCKEYKEVEQKELLLDEILNIVSRITQFSIPDIKSQSRKEKIVIARQIYIYLAHKYTLLKYPTIGSKINRDRSTVYHHLNAVKDLLDIPGEKFLQETLKMCEYLVVLWIRQNYLINKYGTK